MLWAFDMTWRLPDVKTQGRAIGLAVLIEIYRVTSGALFAP